VAVAEVKSHIGPSFGNNFNNRAEEAIGSASDLWCAYREGAFEPSKPPWLGYLMLVEECDRSMRPVANREPHFCVFPEFVRASYVQRYENLLLKLVRERLYDATALIVSSEPEGERVQYREPNCEIAIEGFVASLAARVASVV
jgi:hypothetical protein